MPKLSILAEQFAGFLVAESLREHSEDRTNLLDSLHASFEQDQRIRAAWLWGSFGRGDSDDLSDLDIWLIVDDDSVTSFGEALRHHSVQTGNFISGGENSHNAPAGGGYFGAQFEGHHGLLHMDCYWQPESADLRKLELLPLFDRRNDPVSKEDSPQPGYKTSEFDPDQDEIEYRLGFVWLMLSITAKYLARDPESDMSLMQYPRPSFQEAAQMLSRPDLICSQDWEIPATPKEKVDCIRNLVEKASGLAALANHKTRGCSPLNSLCLIRYLDMIDSIIANLPDIK